MEKSLQLKSNTLLVFSFQIFEELANTRLVGPLEKCGLFSDFQYGFSSFQSTADLLAVLFDKTTSVFSRCGATRAITLNISKVFDLVCHTGFYKRKSYGILGQILGLISLDEKSSQEYPVNAEVRQGSILGPRSFLLYINGLPDNVIRNIAIYADDTSLYSKCYKASDLWQHLQLASEEDSDLRDTVEWNRKWLADFSAGKTQLVSFDWSNEASAIDVKMDGFVLKKNLFLKMLGFSFSSKLGWGSHILFISKTASNKQEP